MHPWRANAPPRLRAPLLLLLPALLALPALPLLAGGAVPGQRSVSVLYAGSLGAVMENGLGPAFHRTTGIDYQGEAQGSLGAAQMIRGRVRTPDVFISADPLVDVAVLMGPANGELVRWFSILASSQLVLAFNPHGRFAARFTAAQARRIPWYEALLTPGVHFGRGDPTIDPKGYRTLFLFRLAGRYYHRPDIPALLGDPLNPAQVFPEIALLARMDSGQFDAGIFYKHEAVAHRLPYISLPPEINLGDSRFAALYAHETYTAPSGQRVSGAPILFTVTIPETVRHRDAALACVRFLLSSDALLEQFGFGRQDHQVGGDAAQVPAALRDLMAGPWKP